MNAWDRLPAEPTLWYQRFDSYRLLGPARNLDAAYRAHSGNTHGRAGAAWRKNAEKWHWQRRAAAWDDAEADRLHQEEADRRRAARETRIRLLHGLRRQAWSAIGQAHLAKLSEEEARQMLGSLRLLFFDALKWERIELGEPTEIIEERDTGPVLDAKVQAMIEKVYGDENQDAD